MFYFGKFRLLPTALLSRVMHKGELIEQGKHADLLARDGEYAKLFKLQADAFITDEHVSPLMILILR